MKFLQKGDVPTLCVSFLLIFFILAKWWYGGSSIYIIAWSEKNHPPFIRLCTVFTKNIQAPWLWSLYFVGLANAKLKDWKFALLEEWLSAIPCSPAVEIQKFSYKILLEVLVFVQPDFQVFLSASAKVIKLLCCRFFFRYNSGYTWQFFALLISREKARKSLNFSRKSEKNARKHKNDFFSLVNYKELSVIDANTISAFIDPLSKSPRIWYSIIIQKKNIFFKPSLSWNVPCLFKF